MEKLSNADKFRSAIQIVIGGHIFAAALATYRGDEWWYKKCLMPLLQLFGPEQAHRLAVKAARYGLMPRMQGQDDPKLKTSLWGYDFSNPIGLAAGFDKQGECVDGLLKLGFSFVEVGTITPNPQSGNPKPRVFRLPEDKAVINRYGFNSEGHGAVLQRLQSRHEVKQEHGIVGVNLGKNKDSKNAIDDYVSGVKTFGAVADYLVINVSSPNTPGLRAMQSGEILEELITKVLDARSKLDRPDKPPLLIKLAPDLTELDKTEIAAVVMKPNCHVDGLIISNTTISRPSNLQSHLKSEVGGLSGKPLKDLATQTIGDMYKLTQGKIPIIGVGGITSGQDVIDKMKAGASLVQLYTALIYDGPPLIARIKRELHELLEKENMQHISDIVGLDVKKPGS